AHIHFSLLLVSLRLLVTAGERRVDSSLVLRLRRNCTPSRNSSIRSDGATSLTIPSYPAISTRSPTWNAALLSPSLKKLGVDCCRGFGLPANVSRTVSRKWGALTVPDGALGW